MRLPPAILAALLGGAGALVAEVVYFRRLALLTGVTATAAATTAAVYLAGLALGAALGGRLADRLGPRVRRLYVGAELVGAAWVLVSPWLFEAAGPAVHALGDSTGAAVLAAIVLVSPAAVAGGATFPALVRTVGDPRRVGWLYGLNGAGAALGALAAGLWLPGLLGFTGTGVVAVALGALAAAAALGIRPADASEAAAGSDHDAGAEPGGLPFAAALGAVAAAGALGMAGELGWARLLEQAGPNAGALCFPLLLAAWLGGLALGGTVVSRRLRALPIRWALARPLALAGGATALALAALPWIPPEAVDGHHVGLGPGSVAIWKLTGVYVSADRLLVYLFAAAATGVASGAVLPRVVDARLRARDGLGAGVGLVSATGIAAGVLACGWLGLLPVPGVGVVHTLAGLSAGVLLFAALLARSPALGGCAMLAGLNLGLPPWAALPIPTEEEVVAFVESPSGPSAITSAADGYRTYTHGERVQGLRLGLEVPLALHPAPREVLLIAFGTGLNVPGILADPAVRALTVVDVDPALPALAAHHPDVGPGLFDGARARYVVDDARHHLRVTDTRYDLVYSDVATYAQYAELGTVEFFTLARSRLAPGGVFTCKLHAETVTAEGARRFLATLLRVFPDTWAFRERGTVLTLVSFADRTAPLDLAARWASVGLVYRKNLRRSLPQRLLLDPEELTRLGGRVVQTDDLRLPWPRMLVHPHDPQRPQVTGVEPLKRAARRTPDARRLFGFASEDPLRLWSQSAERGVAPRVRPWTWWGLRLGLSEAPLPPAPPERQDPPPGSP